MIDTALPQSHMLIDKPKDWSSFDVVKKVRNLLRIKKVGHAGTLDPMATGLLVILLHNATKDFAQFQEYEKVYIAEITFGATTDTYDAEGQVVSEYTKEFALDKNQIEMLLQKYTGTLLQIPPVYSAVKINGKSAYTRARKGEVFEVQPKEVTVYKATLLSTEDSKIIVEYTVSSGTYIRSLAHDLGQEIGCGAYLSSLQRTRIGPYMLRDAKTIEGLKTEILSKKE